MEKQIFRVKLIICFLCLLLVSCNPQKSPEKCISSFLSLIASGNREKAASLLAADSRFLPEQAAFELVKSLAQKRGRSEHNSDGTWTNGELEFSLSESQGKYAVSAVIHPELSVYFFLHYYQSGDFESASIYLPPELREEFVLMMKIITVKSAGPDKQKLFENFSVDSSAIDEETAEVSYTIDGKPGKYKLRYEENNWEILYPVKNLWN